MYWYITESLMRLSLARTVRIPHAIYLGRVRQREKSETHTQKEREREREKERELNPQSISDLPFRERTQEVRRLDYRDRCTLVCLPGREYYCTGLGCRNCFEKSNWWQTVITNHVKNMKKEYTRIWGILCQIDRVVTLVFLFLSWP